MEALFIIPLVCTFIVTFITIPFWIKGAKRAKLIGKDIHKKNTFVPESGGIPVISGTIFGILILISLETFIFNDGQHNLELMAAMATLLMITLIGLVDDILGWKIGLRQSHKPLLVLLAALPLVAINSGETIMALPFLGRVSIGLLYPLVIIPVAISGSSNGFNMLAGYNGLEAGMGIIILTTLSFLSFTTTSGLKIAGILGLIMVTALLAFFHYNRYPARIFPGDSLTYPIGGMIAIVTILGNVEKVALFLFLPYFIQFFLKMRGKFKKESFGKLLEDGSLDQPYDKIYGLEHLAIKVLKKVKGKATESNVVLLLFSMEIILIAITMFIHW